MTTSTDIVSWGVLEGEGLLSHLESGLLTHLERTTSILPCCLFLVFILLYLLAFLRAQDLKKDHIHTRTALQALVTVVVPACSLWPSRYIELASAHRSHTDIPLGTIIKDTINGVIELYNPCNDLVNLISLGATINGHTIRINLGWKWWIKYLEWQMPPVKVRITYHLRNILATQEPLTGQRKPGYPSLRSPGYTLQPFECLHGNMYTTSSNPQNPSPSLLAASSWISRPSFCLDCLPHDTTPSLHAGCKVTLEFTVFSASLRTLSTAQVISVIPFMISHRPRRRPRSLVSVLEQLRASYGPNLVIDSLSNVSVDYEHTLRCVYESFSGEQNFRRTWVKIQGIKAWRQEMFLVALEAALVHLGWIERWAVQVTVK